MLTLFQSTESEMTAPSSTTQSSPITLLLMRALAPTRAFLPMRTDPFSPAVKSTRLPSPSQMALSSPSTLRPGIVDRDRPRQDVLVRQAILQEVADVPPVPGCHVAEEPAPLPHHQREEVLAEIELPPRRDQLQDRRLEQIDAGVHRVAEHLAPGRFLQEAADAAVRLGDHDPVLQRVLDPREQDGEIGLALAVKGDGGAEVEIGQDVAADHQEGSAEVRLGVLHRAGRPEILAGGDVRHPHAERRAVPK